MVKRKRQTTQWPSEKDRQRNGQAKKIDNTMAKRKRQTTQWPSEKDRQHNGQTKKTDNTMAKRKIQTTQWPNEKVQRDKQRSTQSITQKTKDQAIRTPLKTGGKVRFASDDICTNNEGRCN
jgi:hypothetical protein